MEGSNYRVERFTLSQVSWWILAHLVAIALALMTWSWCYNTFRFPEEPRNFKTLQKLGFIGEIDTYSPLDAPAAGSASPQYLYELFFGLEPEKVNQINDVLIRGYITNYEKIPVYRYLDGDFRIIAVRPLEESDFLYPGLLVQARAYVKAQKNERSSPYPVVIDYFVPTDVKDAQKNFQKGDLLELVKSKHCATLLNLTKEGKESDPTLRATVVPLAYNIYISPDGKEIPLSAADRINIDSPLPVRLSPSK